MKEKKLQPKRIKRRLVTSIFLIIIALLLIIGKNVKAGTQDSTLVRNKIDGIYAIAPLSDKTHLYNLEIYKVNNKISYCIEIGKKITTSTYDSTYSDIQQQNITKLSLDQLNYIKALAYFGYGYTNHTDNKYYMATQELIWEYLNKIDVTWTNELDINGPKINIDTYKNEIISLAKKYINNPSFNSPINCKIGDKITLTDTTGVSQFYQPDPQNKQKSSLNNNVLNITINENYIGEDNLKLIRKNNIAYPAGIYNFSDSQILLSQGALSIKEYNIKLNIKGETLTTNLIDKDNKTNKPSGQASLVGAVYEIYDKDMNLITTFTTNESGTNIIDNLYHDTYYIKQIKASKGYKLNNNIIKIDLTSTNNHQFLEEEVIKNTIEINKLFELDNNNEREANIVFKIYDYQNNLYSTLTTTKEGPDIITLPYGEYTIKQENTTYGYNKVKDIKINIEKEQSVTVKYDLLDTRITTKIHVNTLNKETNNKILDSNIKYKLKNKETNKYITYTDKNQKIINEFSTNSSGELTFPFLVPYGDYILEQTTPPNKYIENNEKILITINDKSTYTYTNNEVFININFYNEPIKGQIIVNTKKEIFTINNHNYNIESTIRPSINIELSKDNEVVNTYKTDNNGYLLIDNLELSKYCLKDTDTKEEKCIDLINEDNKTKTITKNIEFNKIINTTNLIITNIDNYHNPIENTTIEIYKDNELIKTDTTNKKGQITINNIPTGTYCIKETKISDNYILENEKKCMYIEASNKETNMTIMNRLKEKTISIPNTLSNINPKHIITILILIIIGVIIHKKNNNNTINS